MSKVPLLKNLVGNGKLARFQNYRHNEFTYMLDCGFVFTVPVADINGNSELGPYESAMAMMKWIKQRLDLIKDAEKNNGSA